LIIVEGMRVDDDEERDIRRRLRCHAFGRSKISNSRKREESF
jgi:hypothetical protein